MRIRICRPIILFFERFVDLGHDDVLEGEGVYLSAAETFDFGREYLAAWTEYRKANEEAKPDDLTVFYELLFARLNSPVEKDYIKTIQIVCIDPLNNGEWIANIKDNEELQDAIFGGMMSEMKALAAE